MLNPVTNHREFFGAPGAVVIAGLLPLTVVFFHLIVNENYSIQGLDLDLNRIADQIPKSWSQFAHLAFDPVCWKAYAAWFFGLAVVHTFGPGKDVNGTVLRDGTQLTYRINGPFIVSTLWVLLAARFFSANYSVPELQFLYDNTGKLIWVTIISGFLLSFAVYGMSFVPLRTPNGFNTRDRILSENGNSGNKVYDWFIGRELNPRIGPWDIKAFCELRPGMLLLFFLNLSCIQNQWTKQGRVSNSLVLVNVFQAVYIFDAVLGEEASLSMPDIAHDGFGFMLAFGDLAWLPWTYSLQARYLAIEGNSVDLSWPALVLIVALNVFGSYIYRASNKQKADFKAGRLDHMKSISTPSGSKLLADGWWAVSQHINYLGDWFIAWSWCLPTGFQTPVTYFYVLYLATLLVHRQTRDDTKCSAKYGEAWAQYKKQVPFKIVPFVY